MEYEIIFVAINIMSEFEQISIILYRSIGWYVINEKSKIQKICM